MVEKYSKPIVRNLGETITNAEGYCLSGSHADTDPGSDCASGTSALGAVCAYGGYPGPDACHVGGVPVYFGCHPGTGAAGLCNTGLEVT